jgi:hypothetical protein
MGRTIRSVTAKGGAPILDALFVLSHEDQRGRDGLDRLVRQVLRKVLEQLHAGQATEETQINVAK